MSTRSVIIDATAELLAQSPGGDISTRAVCEAAGVQQPVIYRLFGDKEGLLAATVDQVWDQYLGMKRAAEESADPLSDLRAGWDSHNAFALAQPNAYRLLFGSGSVAKAESANEAMRLLQSVLERLAAQGRLRVAPEIAARVVMAANTGVALALILRPALYPDPAISSIMRDIVLGGLVSDTAPAPDAGESARIAAITLRTSRPTLPPALFTGREAGLLDEWLERIQSSSPSD
ncbi:MULTISPECIES: TetR/AcrR family transcriptional regulator [unclassified Cryobacterium]|uniref:TetR/AcrR family transcriptional regulator n=1 Tax=unclassified Cryobacterium TaxID=2649013 RepID=UPI00106A55A3|nr:MULTISPECIES: TetR/AcrR family transcriptional regulator [unclassified Cryobacterium]MDY7528969.1 TetR/AcrR family transcriptional regulator [Cryobacterium sp. 10C2]MDY7558866.1 TetR/AcrR family transcriptional regulator [Cryobacterium sp. 10C3]MEB0200777.1 TetR/AcrR family transcriptional regulator [Cryobacterium sp. 5I3]MEB0285614.1 TetR/AcrR family transcriptional regulator [Cryobacterium sp. 10S3]MEB0290803.1 TetR/AcrR family transcriptional regulator [Cryobacterium sp. 10C2]